MRWALRNQQKIREQLGESLLERMQQSLKFAFDKYGDNISCYITEWENEPYPVLVVDDAGHSFNVVSFYVVRKMYDVYMLAFKEFIG